MKMKSRVYRLHTGVYIALDHITAFGRYADGDDDFVVNTTDGRSYDANEKDIQMIAALLS